MRQKLYYTFKIISATFFKYCYPKSDRMYSTQISKTFFIILACTIYVTSCSGQGSNNTTYKVGNLPNIERFEKLTKREFFLDTMKMRHDAEKIQRLKDGTAFIEGVSDEEKKEAIEYITVTSLRYKENRSRYYLESFVNYKRNNEAFEGIDTLTSECSCYLSGDSIKIQMGTWVFGGYQFIIQLTKKDFQSFYWEDTHKQKIYKQQLSDSVLVDNVTVDIKDQNLSLQTDQKLSLMNIYWVI